ncbi:F-box/LRR-repeat protein 4 [Cornus florida]|uniref:F-box/LRR-repeat protein 4 n=1 Tax=Cornus florida TaxID=4283 RepID=UPI00289B4920|nr:F-box/LRR-repeat protein 4 [Cornus florida]
MALICVDLPDECWELIFNRLNHHSHFEALSLVCKRFLSISNRLRVSLAIVDPTILIHGTISKLLHRFKHLKSIDLSKYDGDIDLNRVIIEIAQSNLNLETLNVSKQKCLPLEGLKRLGSNMKGLKFLNCSNLSLLRDVELRVIAYSLPCLEELDISYPVNDFDFNLELRPHDPSEIHVTDSGFEVLSRKLSNLRKINISGNYFITNRSLVALSSSCVLLREIKALDCSFITQDGIHFVMSHSPDLSSISVSGIWSRLRSPSFEDSLSYPTALGTLHLYGVFLSDKFLYSLAKACIPLKSFGLFDCLNFSLCGISLLLHTYHSLDYLALSEVDFLTDQAISDLSQYLQKLITIKLNGCTKLTSSTFFTLAKNCTLLTDIEMERTNLRKEDCSMDFVKNPRIKSLSFAGSTHLNDECLKRIASACPGLELLDLSSCLGIAEGGLAEILKSCCEIRHLRIDDCGGIKNIGTGSELPKLEVLRAARSGINSEGLAMIGKRCCGLLNLDLEGCLGVTTERVKEVIRNCTRLREINLKHCQNVNVISVDWMVFSRPSLRKIIPPPRSFCTEKQKKLLLCHGCQVCEL